MCDQVAALLPADHREESASSRLGFQVVTSALSDTESTTDFTKVNSRLISSHIIPGDCPVDSAILIPRLLHGEVAQGFWTASYVPQMTRICSLDYRSCSRLCLKQLL